MVDDGKNDEVNDADDDGDGHDGRGANDDDRRSKTRTKRRPRARASRTKRPDLKSSRSAWWRPRVCAAPSSRENHCPPVCSPPRRSRPPPRTDHRLPSCKRTRTTTVLWIVSCPAVAVMAHTGRATAKSQCRAAPRCSTVRPGSAHGSRLGSARLANASPFYSHSALTRETAPPPLPDGLALCGATHEAGRDSPPLQRRRRPSETENRRAPESYRARPNTAERARVGDRDE